MAKFDIHTNWAEKLEAYASGRLTNAEMHELEAAAQSDPFLMDALEGYVMMAKENKIDAVSSVLKGLPEKDLADRNAKVVPLLSRRWVQWAVAASIILLVGIGIFNQFGQEDKQSAIALIDDNQPEAAAEVPGAPELRDTITSTIVPADLPQQIVRNADNLPKGKLPDKGNTNVGGEAIAPTSLNADEGAKRSMTAAEAPVIFSVKGKVVDDENKEPIDNAIVSVAGREVISDPIGRFELGAPALPAEIRVGARGYRTKLFQWNEGDAFLQIELQKLPPTTEEVVVNKVNTAKNGSGLVVIPNDTSLTAPIGGWQNFDAYFRQNMKAKGTSKIYKSVSMSFAIDAAGRPVEIEVSQSAGREAEAEAVRLLQNGPKWKVGKGAQPYATITVKY